MAGNNIVNVAVHDLQKVGDDFQVVLGNSKLSISSTVQSLVDKLHDLYSRRTSKSHGQFSSDQINYPTQSHLQEYLQAGDAAFAKFTQALMMTLMVRAKAKPGATGGHVFFAHFVRDDRHFLLVAIVNDTLSAALTQSHDVAPITHLDIEGFRFAGRINITGWSNGEERYIGFLKGKRDVAEYFQDFLGCETSTQEKADTKALVDALQRFTQQQGMDQDQRTNFLARAKEICDRAAKKKEELSFDALTNELVPDDPQPLRHHLADPDLKLNDGFVPNARMLGMLVRFKAKTKLWSIEFDREAIREGQIIYDRRKGTITLKQLPPELRQELSEEYDA